MATNPTKTVVLKRLNEFEVEECFADPKSFAAVNAQYGMLSMMMRYLSREYTNVRFEVHHDGDHDPEYHVIVADKIDNDTRAAPKVS